ncbi:MAG: DNA-directed RNA polymerase subunit B [archaeon]|jgi:DNA-directed RNA polymerase subunit B
MTKSRAKIYVNGGIVGFHDDPEKLRADLLKKRRTLQIDSQINIAFDENTNELYINTDAGRVQRPVIIVDKGQSRVTAEIVEDLKSKKMTWQDLLAKGIVEFLDAEEEENAYIALTEDELTPDHTHLEISGTAIFSIVSSMIPFIEHNMAGKAIHGAKLYKQAIGIPSSNYNLRFDTEMHCLYYPQKPLVFTRTEDLMHMEKRPMIQNAIVAIMPFRGFNMLDAYIINQGSIQRAFGRSSYYRAYSATEIRYPSGQTDKFTIPTEDASGYRGTDAYANLDESGIANLESKIVEGGVIIGMTSPPRFVEEVSEFGVVTEERRDTSVCSRKHLEGYIDRVMLSETISGTKLCKIRVRTYLEPQVGDKFTSHHAQKGVVGAVIKEEDMPFTSEGIKPDFILNPHSIPSRMTLGHLFESIAGKTVAASGKAIDGTPFNNDKDEIFKMLKEYGFRPDGKETFYDGKTGEKIEMPIFVGPLAFERLQTHLVVNRIQARDKGPVQLLTRQPTEGKQKGGGLRFGEMEGEALVAHGAAMTLQEKLMDDADEMNIMVCEDCGIPAVDDKIRNKRYCPVCNGTNVHQVKISYGFKLLLDELKAMGVYPKLVLGDKID